MPGSAEKYTIEFQVELAKLRKAYAEIKRMQAELNKMHKGTTRLQKRARLEKTRHQKRHSKDVVAIQKVERKHIKDVARDERGRFKSTKKHLQETAALSKKERIAHTGWRKKEEKEVMRGPLGVGFSGGGKGPGRFRRGVGKVGGAAAAIGGGIIGFMLATAMGGYRKYTEHEKELGGMLGMADPKTIHHFNQGQSARLGFSAMESSGHMKTMGRATGSMAPLELQQAMRSTGLGAGEAGDIFGTIRRGGAQFTSKKGEQSQGAHMFSKMIAGGMQSGLERARLPEYFSGVQSLMKSQQSITSRDVTAGSFMKLMNVLGQTGLSGFRGQRGAGVLGQLDQAIKQPGGGDWGKAIAMRAMGFGQPGKAGISYFEAEKQREKGISDEKNVSALLEQYLKEAGGDISEAALMFREGTGLKLQTSEDLLKIAAGDQPMEEKLANIGTKLEESKPLAEQTKDATKGSLVQLQHIASTANKSLKAGKKIAPAVRALERLQWDAFELFVEQAKNGKELLHKADEIYKHLTGGDKEPAAKARKRYLEAAGDAMERARKATTSRAKASFLEDALRLRRKARGAVGREKWEKNPYHTWAPMPKFYKKLGGGETEEDVKIRKRKQIYEMGAGVGVTITPEMEVSIAKSAAKAQKEAFVASESKGIGTLIDVAKAGAAAQRETLEEMRKKPGVKTEISGGYGGQYSTDDARNSKAAVKPPPG